MYCIVAKKPLIRNVHQYSNAQEMSTNLLKGEADRAISSWN